MGEAACRGLRECHSPGPNLALNGPDFITSIWRAAVTPPRVSGRICDDNSPECILITHIFDFAYFSVVNGLPELQNSIREIENRKAQQIFSRITVKLVL